MQRETDGLEIVIEPRFHEQFLITKPTVEYECLLSHVPEVQPAQDQLTSVGPDSMRQAASLSATLLSTTPCSLPCMLHDNIPPGAAQQSTEACPPCQLAGNITTPCEHLSGCHLHHEQPHMPHLDPQLRVQVFVGHPRRLRSLVEALCPVMAKVFALKHQSLPPWRTAAAMLSKWRLSDTPTATFASSLLGLLGQPTLRVRLLPDQLCSRQAVAALQAVGAGCGVSGCPVHCRCVADLLYVQGAWPAARPPPSSTLYTATSGCTASVGHQHKLQPNNQGGWTTSLQCLLGPCPCACQSGALAGGPTRATALSVITLAMLKPLTTGRG